MNLAVTLHRDLKEYDKAEQEYRRVLQDNPERLWVHHNLGLLFAARSKHMQAIKEYHKELKLQRHSIATHFVLGVSLKDIESPYEADRAFSTVLRLEPDCYEAHYELGTMLLDIVEEDLERLERAEHHLREAIRTGTDNYKYL